MGCDIHPNFEKRVTREDGTKVWEKILDHKYEGNRHYFLFGWLANVRNGYGFAGCDTGDGIKPLAMPRGLPEDIAVSEPVPPYSDDMEYKSPEYQLWSDWYENNDYGEHSQSWLTGEESMEGLKTVGGTRKRGMISLMEYAAWDKVSQPDGWCGDVGGGNTMKITPAQAARISPKVLANIKGIFDALDEVSKYGRWTRRRVWRFRRIGKPSYAYDAFVSEKYPLHPGEETELVLDWESKYKIRPVKAKQQAKLRKYQDRLLGKKSVFVPIEWFLSNEKVQKEFAYFTDEVKRLMDLHGEIRMVFGFDS